MALVIWPSQPQGQYWVTIRSSQARTESWPAVLVIHNQCMEILAEPLHLLRCMGDVLWYKDWSWVAQVIDVLFSLPRRKNKWRFHKWKKNCSIFAHMKSKGLKTYSISKESDQVSLCSRTSCAAHYVQCVMRDVISTQSKKFLRLEVVWIWHKLSLYNKVAEEL